MGVVVNVGEGRPVGGVYEIFEQSSADLKVQTGRPQQLLATDRLAVSAEAPRLKRQPVK